MALPVVLEGLQHLHGSNTSWLLDDGVSMHGCRAEDMQNGAALHSSESIENAKDEDTIRSANDAIIVAIGIVAVLVANVAYVGALQYQRSQAIP